VVVKVYLMNVLLNWSLERPSAKLATVAGADELLWLQLDFQDITGKRSWERTGERESEEGFKLKLCTRCDGVWMNAASRICIFTMEGIYRN
jgi:hypothetical protein